MSLELRDRVRETTTVTGLNDATLLGAVTGFQAFSVIGNGNTCYYTISDQSGGNWETGIGTFNSIGPTLVRTTVLDSSAGGAKVSFPAGTKDVFVTYPSDKAVYLDASGDVQPALGTVNATTVDTTNLEVTNLKAKDGTSAGSIANSTGVVTLASSVLTTTDINGGTIDGTTIGGASAAAGNFTTLGATGVATFSAGTVSAPAITTTGDTNTGIFFPAADTIAFTEGGVESMRINSSGNLGIGTGSPAAKIDARLSGTSSGTVINVGNTGSGEFGGLGISDGGTYPVELWGSSLTFKAGSSIYASATEKMRIDSSGNVGIGASSITNWGGYRTLQIGTSDSVLGHLALYNSTGRAAFVAGNTGGAAFGSGINIPVVFEVNSTERMRIDSSGNVGIGTSSVGQKLVISDSSAGQTLVNIVNTSSGGYSWNIGTVGSTAGLASVGSFIVRDSTNGANRIVIDTSGNVGIGTSASVQRLTVWGAGTLPSTIANCQLLVGNTDGFANAGLALVTSAGNASSITFGSTASPALGRIEYENPTNYMRFLTNSTERMRIDSSGNVLVGTTGAFYSTAGRGLVEASGSSSSMYALKVSATPYGYFAASATVTELAAVGASQPLLFTTNSAERMRIDSSGRIAFGSQGTSSDRLIDAAFQSATLAAGATQFGFVFNPTYPNTATTNLFNIYAGPNITSGATITNVFGLYIEAINASGSTVTNRYGVYQASASDKNLFEGNVQVNNGITFPATQSASANANTLDDYEEGTWTPSQGAGLTVVGFFTSVGSYVKIGRMVTITGSVAATTSVAIGPAALLCANLPFVVASGDQSGLGGLTNNALNQANTCWTSPGNSDLYATEAIAATVRIWFSATYFV
jgi:hypothetical protein